MSSANRNDNRNFLDQYFTPSWTVDKLLEKLELPGGMWLEPCVGSGAIVGAVNKHRSDIDWRGNEIDQSLEPLYKPLVTKSTSKDFLTLQDEDINYLTDGKGKFDVVLTNPPFAIAFEFLQKSLQISDTVVFLLRLNFLEGKKRCDFMQRHTPDVYVLPQRPSFTGKGTDSTSYAWFVWTSAEKTEGKLQILNKR